MKGSPIEYYVGSDTTRFSVFNGNTTLHCPTSYKIVDGQTFTSYIVEQRTSCKTTMRPFLYVCIIHGSRRLIFFIITESELYVSKQSLPRIEFLKNA